MSVILKRLLTIAASVLLLAYVVYQGYLTFYHPMRTQKAQSSTVRDSVTVQLLMLHSDTVITGSAGAGVIDYTRGNGERVPKGGVIANVYASAQDAQKAAKLAAINAKIAKLRQYGGTASGDVAALDSDIGSQMLSLADASSASGLESIEAAGDKLLDLLNRKQVETGTVKDFTAVTAALTKQAADLGTVNPTGTISSPVAGCFVSTTDGYENVDVSSITSLSTSALQKLLSRKTSAQAGAVGKVISGGEWYMAAKISKDDAVRIPKGASMTVRFPSSSQDDVPVTVRAVNKSSDGCALVLGCGSMTDKLAVMRRETAELVIDNVTGIKIDNDNIHIVGSDKGVYILRGNTVQFKKIVPVYSGNGFTVSGIDSADSSRLQVYDSVIIGGDDLYDGKIVN